LSCRRLHRLSSCPAHPAVVFTVASVCVQCSGRVVVGCTSRGSAALATLRLVCASCIVGRLFLAVRVMPFRPSSGRFTVVSCGCGGRLPLALVGCSARIVSSYGSVVAYMVVGAGTSASWLLVALSCSLCTAPHRSVGMVRHRATPFRFVSSALCPTCGSSIRCAFTPFLPDSTHSSTHQAVHHSCFLFDGDTTQRGHKLRTQCAICGDPVQARGLCRSCCWMYEDSSDSD